MDILNKFSTYLVSQKALYCMKHVLGRNSVQEDAPADTFNLWIIKGFLVNSYNMHNLVCCALQSLVCVIKTHLMLGTLL